METTEERARRIDRLERDRSQRRSQSDEGPVEIAPGRGDLRFTSQTIASNQDIGYAQNPVWYLDDYWWQFGSRTVSFATIFATQPWIAAAVMRMLTWSIRVPLKVYERLDDNSRRRLGPEDHPLAAAVVDPWDRGSQAQLTMSLLGPVLVHGNSVTRILEGASDRITFDPKDWRYCAPIRPWRDSLEGFVVDNDNSQFTQSVSIDEVLHVAWWSPTGPLGISPLQQLGVTLRIEDAAQIYQQQVFNNGARPPSAITASDEFLGLDKDERREIIQQLRKDVTSIYAGPYNSGKPAILPPGLDWKPIGHTSVEAELVDQRKIARDEISAVYLIPPPMLGILDKATYSNIETQREMIYTECVGPPLLLIEQMLNAQVARAMLGETAIYCEFDFAGVLRGDRLQEIQALREAIGSALMTPNEGRTVLNMQASDQEGMDDFYLPTNNLSPVGTGPSKREEPGPPPTGKPQDAGGVPGALAAAGFTLP